MTGKFIQIVLSVDYFFDNSILVMIKGPNKLDYDTKRLGYLKSAEGLWVK